MHLLYNIFSTDFKLARLHRHPKHLVLDTQRLFVAVRSSEHLQSFRSFVLFESGGWENMKSKMAYLQMLTKHVD